MNEHRDIIQSDAEKFKTFSLKELESILQVSNRTLQSYVKSGRLKATKIGGRWRVTPENLKKFIDGE